MQLQCMQTGTGFAQKLPKGGGSSNNNTTANNEFPRGGKQLAPSALARGRKLAVVADRPPTTKVTVTRNEEY
jgi:hypothetical protein